MNGWKINNLPANVKGFVVAVRVDDELWFYGAYDTIDKAFEVCDMASDFQFCGEA